jgi:hypothetical protein
MLVVQCAAFDADFYTDLSNIWELLPTIPGYAGPSADDGMSDAASVTECDDLPAAPVLVRPVQSVVHLC